MNDPRGTAEPARYRFRDLHPRVRLGTASDRYAGWLGQIYSPERFAHRVTRRQKTLGTRRFTEELLPVECVAEYFEHFPVLELDFTFYRPLLDAAGEPTANFHTLARYRQHLRPGDRLLLKAPQAVTAHTLYRGSAPAANPGYLDPSLFTARFYRPAVDLLGEHLGGILLEQEYHRSGERQPPEEVAAAWERFFASVPEDPRYHLELRTPGYLAPPLFAMLGRRGVGQVLSHWTWLPSLGEQLRRASGRFTNAGQTCVVRLLTPRNVRYADAYAAAHPFDRLVAGMLDPHMVSGTVELLRTAVSQSVETDVIVNNRAGGNAPEIARQ
ncbi:MAG: DUF72 domain-containing protein, partial [Deferrisomatales bacterium]|nr:DUF72 domain-containing protein [Deferrisomatales bacterium]